MNLRATTNEENDTFPQNNTKVLTFLRRHIDEELKSEYFMIKDPLIFWINFKE